MVRYGETGRVTLSDSIDNGVSASVSFSVSYTSPVVIAYMATFNGSQPIGVRVRNVTSNGCEVFMEEPDNEGHSAEDVNYLVVEAGTHTTSSGLQIEAGTVSTADAHTGSDSFSGGAAVSFATSFASAPVVASTLNTYANGAFMESAVHSLDATGMNVLQEAAGSGNTASTETIGWVAVSPGSGSSETGDAIEAIHVATDGSNDGVENSAASVSFSSFSTAPDVLVQQTTHNEVDGSWARGGDTWSSTAHSFYAEEDTAADTEQGHGDEEFAVLSFTPNSGLGIREPVAFTQARTPENHIDGGWTSRLLAFTEGDARPLTLDADHDRRLWSLTEGDARPLTLDADHDRRLEGFTDAPSPVQRMSGIPIPSGEFRRVRVAVVDGDGEPLTAARWVQSADIFPTSAPVDENGIAYLWLLDGIQYQSFLCLGSNDDTKAKWDYVWYEADGSNDVGPFVSEATLVFDPEKVKKAAASGLNMAGEVSFS